MPKSLLLVSLYMPLLRRSNSVLTQSMTVTSYLHYTFYATLKVTHVLTSTLRHHCIIR